MSINNIESSVNSYKKQIRNQRKNSSVEKVGTMDRSSSTSSFGVHEPPAGENKNVVPDSSKKSLRIISTSNRLIRRSSGDKFSRPSIQSKNKQEDSQKSAEKNVETEPQKLQSKLRNDFSDRMTSKQKSNTVTDVTKRSNLKVKTKDFENVKGGFGESEEYSEDKPKELTRSSNARLRLKELTQKALKTHRFKQIETQTENNVLRVKEVSTDVHDLRLSRAEIRNVDTTTLVETKDAMVDCSLLVVLTKGKNLLQLTNTVGVQCSDISSTRKPETEYPPSIDFSLPERSGCKFLKNKSTSREYVKFNISSPILTNFLVPNTSYQEVNGTTGSLSDDSLDDQDYHNMLFPTPDLISNHNSLDPNIHPIQSEKLDPISSRLRIRYAQENMNDVHYDSYKYCKSPGSTIETAIVTRATRISAINIPICVFLPETKMCDIYSACDYLILPQFDYARAVTVRVDDSDNNDVLTISEPRASKSVVRSFSNRAQMNDSSTSFMSDQFLQYNSESFDIHRANATEYLFLSRTITGYEKNMLEAMSSVLSSITEQMTNIPGAEKAFAARNLDTYVTSVDFHDHTFCNEQNAETVSCCDSSSQTSPLTNVTRFTQYEVSDFSFNKWDLISADPCQKFKKRLFSIGIKASREFTPMKNFLFSTNSFEVSRYPSITGPYEDISLEGRIPSCWGYTSIGQRGSIKQLLPICRPSEFLGQLSHMRKNIIRSSKIPEEGS